MKRLSGLLFGVALVGLLYTSVNGQEKKAEPKKADLATCCGPLPSFKHLDGCRLVFVANGVGGSTAASDNLIDLNSEMRLGLRVQLVPWCRQNALFQDLVDHDAQLSAATKLACFTAALRKDAPRAEIYYVGHSAGARVVLAAAEMAGEKSVDRIILLHAAVSHCYDLRAALKASRSGIDSFYSSEDGILEYALEYTGMADGVRAHAAGRVGFSRPHDKKEAEAFSQLRQYRWTDQFNGNGGHFAWTMRNNMKRVLPPLFCTVGEEVAPPKK